MVDIDESIYEARRSFTDVNPDSTYHPYIEAAREFGITVGCGADTFCPNNPVTRAEAATLIVRALGWPRVERTGFFEDVPLRHGHRDTIETLKAHCVTTGCGLNRYCPGTIVTRVQAAAFIARAWNLEGINQCLLETCNTEDDDFDGQVDEGVQNACGNCAGEVPTEVCDGVDNDCDGIVDEALVRACGTAVGQCTVGRATCANGGWGVCQGETTPADETCDGRDNDCDETVDEGCGMGNPSPDSTPSMKVIDAAPESMASDASISEDESTAPILPDMALSDSAIIDMPRLTPGPKPVPGEASGCLISPDTGTHLPWALLLIGALLRRVRGKWPVQGTF